MIRKLPFTLFLLVSLIGFSQSQSYYNELDLSKTGTELFQELSAKLKSTHTAIPYTGGVNNAWSVLMKADEDPNNPNNVLLIYGYNDNDGNFKTDRTRDKDERDTGGGDEGRWNREHVFPKSLASPSLETNDPGPGTDVHNLRPADSGQNEERSNRKFADGSGDSGKVSTNGGWYPGDEWKGDVARIIMYMYLRYDGDGTVVANQKTLPKDVGFGEATISDPNMLELFLKWNVEDPVSDFEDQRNPEIEGIQGNRNPFIDNPYLATLIWGGLAAEDRWNMGGSDDDIAPSKVENIQATAILEEAISLSWDASTDNEAVYDYLIYVDGEYNQTSTNTTAIIEGLESSTTYSITIKARDTSSNFSEESDALQVTTLVGPTYLIQEEFEDCGSLVFEAISEASNKDWECQSTYGSDNSGSMEMNGFQEDENSLDWLITKEKIDFDVYAEEKLSMYADATYGNSPLTLEYSSEYDGTGSPSDFNWVAVPNAAIALHDGSSTKKNYSIENVDLSSLSGKVFIAVKYASPGSGQTRWTIDDFEISVENASGDSDGDGVANGDDLCPGTAPGEDVDENGCAWEQLDDDNDGVVNGDDICADTPANEIANEAGCAPSQLDDDNDGVFNDKDLCPDTAVNADVDENGCAWEQLDDDNDGVQNGDDLCPNTPERELVNEDGCSESELDDDNDGVFNDKDLCPETPENATVDENGCAQSQLDDDNDGIFNDKDLCPNTPAGLPVDAAGCFTLTADNFAVEVQSETCPGNNDGVIKISAAEAYEYEVEIDGVGSSEDFTSSFTFNDVEPGTYDLCISVKNTTYVQCFTVTIEAAVSLFAKSSTKGKMMKVEIERGTAPFFVSINDAFVLQTNERFIEIPVVNNDKVVVATSKSCEGVFEKRFIEQLMAYPNPAKESVSIRVSTAKKEVVATIMSMDGSLISSQKVAVTNGALNFSIAQLKTGVYFVTLEMETNEIIKIIKE